MRFVAKKTVLATGGLGQIFLHSTTSLERWATAWPWPIA